jgi:hypothetical protein
MVADYHSYYDYRTPYADSVPALVKSLNSGQALQYHENDSLFDDAADIAQFSYDIN